VYSSGYNPSKCNCNYVPKVEIKLFNSAVNGALNARVAHDMTWNRTANLSGGMGHNLALDYVNELMNKEFKG
jgi:hypothetical protein